VQPATVVGWHRVAWRRYWRWKSRGIGAGGTPIDVETRSLIAWMAAENPTWGVRRIAAEHVILGHPVSATTVSRYRGTPAPSPSWRTFFRLHAPDIWAADFFTVQTLTFQTYYVFFVISRDRRRILHWNVTRHPNAQWVWRQVLAATPWNVHPRFLIRDRDRTYGGDFIRRAAGLGITTILTPVRAPKANAIAERVINTIRRECLDHLIVLNERHLREYLADYAVSGLCNGGWRSLPPSRRTTRKQS
jgi:transposase InsO family protein